MRDLNVAALLTKAGVLMGLIPILWAPIWPLGHPGTTAPRAANERHPISLPSLNQGIQIVKDQAKVIVHELIKSTRMTEIAAPPF
mmetsp:Transcript_110551/g.323457  ORF Transcript_110551/g.323457 Transcript_110551/m.323457 type:complete len:85 (-) Transcript_110551:614-868(-)